MDLIAAGAARAITSAAISRRRAARAAAARGTGARPRARPRTGALLVIGAFLGPLGDLPAAFFRAAAVVAAPPGFTGISLVFVTPAVALAVPLLLQVEEPAHELAGDRHQVQEVAVAAAVAGGLVVAAAASLAKVCHWAELNQQRASCDTTRELNLCNCVPVPCDPVSCPCPCVLFPVPAKQNKCNARAGL